MDVLATGAIGSIISKLSDLLTAEYNLQTGVKKQVESLTEELKHAYAFLQKVAKVPPDQLDEQVKVWAREVREASYDMEDVLDAFLVRVKGTQQTTRKRKLQWLEWLQETTVGSFFSKIKARHDIGNAIEQVNKKLKEIAERRRRYKLDSLVVSPATPSSHIDPRVALVRRTSLLIGIDERKDTVTKMLSQLDEKTKTVSLLGSGGVGKTTLAKATYDQLKQEYECGAFVSVGQKPDLVKVFKDILFDLDRVKFNDIHSTQRGADFLTRDLLKFLEDKRYLIVIDDIWETLSRRRITEALPENNCGSRIIITTRISDVAIGEVYKVQPLSDDDSERLFYTRVFGGEDKCPNNQLQQVSEVAPKILRKCGGVPLAIITMASLLVGKSIGEWFEVCNRSGSCYKDKEQLDDKKKEQLDDTMWILSLSYYDLPSHLKTCLLYLSVFPEDYLFEKDVLIWMWIAEGFVNGKLGIGLFEIGEGYFNDLINRSLIQPVEEFESNRIAGCRVHDMILDLCRSLSREENFATFLDSDRDTLLGSNARRLALQNKVVEDTPWDNHTNRARARSFVAFWCSFGSWALQSFNLLRVLYLEGCHLIHFDDHVTGLLHLRFLSICNAISLDLPRRIGDLKFLQVLHLKDVHGLLPSSVGMLTQLVCLHASGMMLQGGTIKDLTSLQELRMRLWMDEEDESCGQFVKELGNLRELRVLVMRYKGMHGREKSVLFKSISNLQKIQHLELHEIEEAAQNGGLPSCIVASRLTNLSYLWLIVKGLDDHGLQILGGLPQLCHLVLFVWCGRATITGTAARGYFPKLRSFSLPRGTILFVVSEDSSNVSFTIWNTIWNRQSDDAPAFGSKSKQDSGRVARATVMPNLEALSFAVRVDKLRACNNGSCDNLGLEYITSLQKVTVCFLSNSIYVGVDNAEVAALRRAIQVHPNRPTLQLRSTTIETRTPTWVLQAACAGNPHQPSGAAGTTARSRRGRSEASSTPRLGSRSTR